MAGDSRCERTGAESHRPAARVGREGSRHVGENSRPLDRVVARDVGAADDGEAGFEALCALGKFLSEAALLSGARLTVVANGLHAFANEQPLQPTKALLHGPARVLPNEVPGLATRVVDIVWPAENAGALVEALIAEARGGTEQFVALRGGDRWVQTVEAGAPIAAPAETPLREGGLYLITGGLGGIGLVLAEDLFRRARARLILLGRSAPSADAQRRIDALRTAGAQVTVVAADVTNEAALRRVREQIGPVNGVIHAAGAAGGGALARRTAAERALVLAPKVQGTLALDRVFSGEPLDFFAVMSSLTAQLGEFGQADYAAANSFLDAYATARRRDGVPMLALAWDAWRDTGMAARFAAAGAPAAWQEEEKTRRITNAEGTEAFHRALTANVAHLIVSTCDFNARRLAASHPVEAVSAPRARPLGRRPALAMAFRAPDGEMQLRIAAVWEELLGIEGIGADDNFFELGGHSLLAVTQIAARLRGAGATGLDAGVIFRGADDCAARAAVRSRGGRRARAGVGGARWRVAPVVRTAGALGARSQGRAERALQRIRRTAHPRTAGRRRARPGLERTGPPP